MERVGRGRGRGGRGEKEVWEKEEEKIECGAIENKNTVILYSHNYTLT